MDRQSQQVMNEKLDYQINLLKELDNIDCNMIQSIYEYKKQTMKA